MLISSWGGRSISRSSRWNVSTVSDVATLHQHKDSAVDLHRGASCCSDWHRVCITSVNSAIHLSLPSFISMCECSTSTSASNVTARTLCSCQSTSADFPPITAHKLLHLLLLIAGGAEIHANGLWFALSSCSVYSCAPYGSYPLSS